MQHENTVRTLQEFFALSVNQQTFAAILADFAIAQQLEGISFDADTLAFISTMEDLMELHSPAAACGKLIFDAITERGEDPELVLAPAIKH